MFLNLWLKCAFHNKNDTYIRYQIPCAFKKEKSISSMNVKTKWTGSFIPSPILTARTETMGSGGNRRDRRKGRGERGTGDSVHRCQTAKALVRKRQVPSQTGTKVFPQGNNGRLNTGSHFKDDTVIQFVVFTLIKVL